MNATGFRFDSIVRKRNKETERGGEKKREGGEIWQFKGITGFKKLL